MRGVVTTAAPYPSSNGPTSEVSITRTAEQREPRRRGAHERGSQHRVGGVGWAEDVEAAGA
jgi:hypothetical protein